MSSSFPSMSTAGSERSQSYIRLSPTSFFNNISNASTPTTAAPSLLTTLMSANQSNEGGPSPAANELVSTPKSHHRKARMNMGWASCARKKLCYPEEGSPSQPQKKGPQNGMRTQNVTPRNVCFVPKFLPSQQPSPSAAPSLKKNASVLDSLLACNSANRSNANQCQSAPVQTNDNFASTNVYATSLRRQQSASATLVSVGNGRYLASGGSSYRSNTAFVRFTPPIGEDVSAIFAGSKFSDSPSAKSLPMPPSHWLDEMNARASALSLLKSPVNQDNTSSDESVKSLHKLAEEELASDDTGVVFDLDDGKCSSPSAISDSSMLAASTEEEVPDSCRPPQNNKEGLRMHPLQLIAAVAAS